MAAALTDGCHTAAGMLLPCLSHSQDVSEVENNCIMLYGLYILYSDLMKIATLTFRMYPTGLVALFRIRNNANCAFSTCFKKFSA